MCVRLYDKDPLKDRHGIKENDFICDRRSQNLRRNYFGISALICVISKNRKLHQTLRRFLDFALISAITRS